MSKILDGYFGLIRKFIPTKAEGSAVGLDIGLNSCKMIELVKNGDDYRILNWSIQTPNGGDQISMVKRALDKVSGDPENVFTSVYGKGTLIRYIDMPRMNLEDLQNSFAIEADKYFPFTQDQIYTDCYILDPQGKSKQMKVMAAASKRELVDERLKLLSDLGVETKFIGMDSVAIANAKSVVDKASDPNEAVALLDLGESVSSLTIMVGDKPCFNRDIHIGGRDLTKRIANALAMEMADAEGIKCYPGDRKDEVRNVCESAISNLVQEVRLSFDYFSTEHNHDIKHVIFTGGASLLFDLKESFEKNLGVSVSVWNPFATISVSDQISKEELTKNSNRLGVALGLALYQYDSN